MFELLSWDESTEVLQQKKETVQLPSRQVNDPAVNLQAHFIDIER